MTLPSIQSTPQAVTTARANEAALPAQRPAFQATSTLTRANEDKSDCCIVAAFKWVISLFKKIFCCGSSEAETSLAPAFEEEPQEVGRLEQIAQLLQEGSDELEMHPVTLEFINNFVCQFVYSEDDDTHMLGAVLKSIIEFDEEDWAVQYYVEETEEGQSLFFRVEGEDREMAYEQFVKHGPKGGGFYIPVFESDKGFVTYARYDCIGDKFKSRIRDLSGELTFIGAVENLSSRIGEDNQSVKSLQEVLGEVAQMARESSFEVVDDDMWGEKLVITFEGLESQEFLHACELFNDIDREALATFYSFETHETRKGQDQVLRVGISEGRYVFSADFLGNDYESLSEEESEEEDF